jgi:hypothetical protein
VVGNAAKDEQVRQHVDDVSSLQSSVDSDCDAFARELVDNVQHPVFPALVPAVFDKVIGPDIFGRSARKRMQDPSLSQSRPRFGCFIIPSRRQMRSTRLSLTILPAIDRRSSAIFR